MNRVLTLFFLLIGNLFSQSFAPNVEETAPNQYRFTWTGGSYTYFLQHSTGMGDWSFFPEIESGSGNYEYNFATTADKMFLRLKYTDTVVPNPETHDFDGDGLTNWEEIRVGGTGTDPLAADTDGDGIRDDGLIYAIANDPDGAGLTPPLLSGLIGRWDFEEQVADPRPGAPSFPLVYIDKTGNSHHAVAAFVTEAQDGMISKGTQHSTPGAPNRLGHLDIDRALLENRNEYSVSFWVCLEKDSLENGGDNFAGLFNFFRRTPVSGAFLYTDNLHGLWLTKQGNSAVLRAGYYTYVITHRKEPLYSRSKPLLEESRKFVRLALLRMESGITMS